MKKPRITRTRTGALAAISLLFLLHASAAGVAADNWRVEWAQQVSGEIVKLLKTACPLADPGDQGAFEACRAKVLQSEFLPDNMNDYLLWAGRKAEGIALEDSGLTQMGKKVWIGLYLPLFMFTGQSSTAFEQPTGKFLLRLEARFRNSLKPGQFPYPFWHSAAKWRAYQEANELVFTIDPRTAKVLAVQRSAFGRGNADLETAFEPAPRKFNKDEWIWRDGNGELQPKVSLFDGIYRPGNPHLAKLDAAYRAFALELRNNNCMICHVPSNPEKMDNLVLLQTPAHAAGEIKRLIRAVKAEAMPAKSWAGPKGIKDPQAKQKFLTYAESFKAEVEAAAAWEIANPATQ